MVLKVFWSCNWKSRNEKCLQSYITVRGNSLWNKQCKYFNDALYEQYITNGCSELFWACPTSSRQNATVEQRFHISSLLMPSAKEVLFYGEEYICPSGNLSSVLKAQSSQILKLLSHHSRTIWMGVWWTNV